MKKKKFVLYRRYGLNGLEIVLLHILELIDSSFRIPFTNFT